MTPVPPGEVATVVTMLEMRTPPPLEPSDISPLELSYWKTPPLDEFRDLFRRVGAKWLWYSRLSKSDEAVSAILLNPLVEVHVVLAQGERVGFVELDFTIPAVAEITFLGLVPELAGHGHGRWLLAHTLALAWRAGIERVSVTTASLDHPAALPAYLRAGFTAVGRAIETFPDPRLLGILDAADAPQTPLLAPAS